MTDTLSGTPVTPAIRVRRCDKTFRAGVVAPALALLGALLVGCTVPPGPVEPTTTPVVDASPSATAVPTATPAPTPSVAAIDELVLRPTTMELRSGGQVVETLDYMSSSANAIGRMTQLFGREPEVTRHEGGNHYLDADDYTWGLVTVRVEDVDWESGSRPRSLLNPEFIMFFDGPAEGSIGLRSANGSRAGDEWSSIARVDPAEGFMLCGGDPVERQRADTPDHFGGAAVVASPQNWGDTSSENRVRWLRAPDLESGGCA